MKLLRLSVDLIVIIGGMMLVNDDHIVLGLIVGLSGLLKNDPAS